MKYFFLIFLLLICTSCTPTEETMTARVTKIIDGDTFLLETSQGLKKIRLLGIDYPDLNKKKWEKLGISKSQVKYCYNKGIEILNKELRGKQVTIKFDKQEKKYDNYGRLLAYLYVGEQSLSTSLVEQGYAIMYDPTKPLCKECIELKELEKQQGCLWT